MTDTSSKGLFPQLTEVLCALTESHAVLLGKVQSLRLERTNNFAVHFPEPSASLVSPSVDFYGDLLTLGQSETRVEAPNPGSDLIDQSVEYGTTVPARSSAEADNVQRYVNTDETTQTPGNDVGLDSVLPNVMYGGSDTRNYNYFDELDARLAGLGEDPLEGDT